MRIRGRRVALLLAGVLPLLAQNDVPNPDERSNDESNDLKGPAEALHDDSLSSLPALHVELHNNLENGEDTMEETIPVEDTPKVIPADSGNDEGQASDDDDNGESLLSKEGINATELPVEEEESKKEEPIEKDSSEPTEEMRELENEPETGDSDDKETPREPLDESTAREEVQEDIAKENAVQEPMEEAQAPATEEQEVSSESSTEKQGDVAEGEDAEATADTQAPGDDDDGPIERLVVDYASKSAGALILEKSPSMKGTSNLLHSDRDKYAIAPCEDKRFVVVGLSEDILVKKVRLANYERYSSPVKDFQIFGSQDMKAWADLGTYTALAKNGEQSFDLVEPSWARYLKFRFLSHHGREHYCTVSQIKVHGSTMLQGFQEQWEENEAGTQEPDGEDANPKGSDSEQQNTIEEEEKPRSTQKEDSGTQTSSDAGAELATRETTQSQPLHSERDETAGTSSDGPSTEESAPVKDSTEKAVDTGVSSKMQQEGNQKEEPAEECNSDMEAAGCDASESSTHSVSEATKGNEEVHAVDPNTLSKKKPSQVEKVGLGGQDRQIMDDASNSSTNLPDALLGLSFMNEGEKSETLSLASIGISSHKAANEERSTTTEQFDTSAISPAQTPVTEPEPASDNLSEMLSETVKDLQEKTADAVKEIQEKIKNSIEGSHIGSAISRLSSMAELDHSGEDKTEDSESAPGVEKVGDETGASDLTPTSESDASSNDEVHKSSDTPKTDQDQQPKVEAEATRQQVEDAHSQPVVESYAPTPVNTGSDSKVGFDSEAVSGLNTSIGTILKRFPSVECLEAMNYQEFKAKMATNAAGAAGGTTSGSGKKMKPIFETLTDEIKVLQINQSVHDQFTKALVSCYQRVLLDVASELENVRVKQDARLLLLEESLREMKAERDSSIFKRVVVPLFAFCSKIVGWLTLALQQGCLRGIELVSAGGISLRAFANEAFSRALPICVEFLSICRGQIVIVWKDGMVERAIQLDGGIICMTGAATFCIFLVAILRGRRRRSSLFRKTDSKQEQVVTSPRSGVRDSVKPREAANGEEEVVAAEKTWRMTREPLKGQRGQASEADCPVLSTNVSLDVVTPVSKAEMELAPMQSKRADNENSVPTRISEESLDQNAVATLNDSSTDGLVEEPRDDAPRKVPALVPLEYK